MKDISYLFLFLNNIQNNIITINQNFININLNNALQKINLSLSLIENNDKQQLKQNLLLNTINLTKEFTYNYQINQFELGQYKIEIIKNLVAKISKQIILELQLL